jgi:TolB-like protein/tetratricopeptide (TPR) repeat protein
MTDFLERLQRALPERYTVERELGRGGMATVVLARERHPNRQVAIKVLEPGLTERLGHERFLREVDLLSSLTHPHIVPIYAAGEAGDMLYYVMPYVRGETLRARLRREGALSMPTALRIAAEIAEALEHAHRNNVVHRDVKPENILLHDGYALVTDFGVAKAITAAGPEQITETGIAVGTPAYMSPEQASGKSEIDGRTDIYALGCVLFEMLTGEPPFGTGTADTVLAKHVTEPPPGPRSRVPAIPLDVERAVLRSLAKSPGARYQSAAEFAEHLMMLRGNQTSGSRRVAVGAGMLPRFLHRGWRARIAAVLGLLVVAAVVWQLTRGPGPTLRAAAGDYRDSVSVVPVRNLTRDAWLDRVGDALTYDVISSLQRIPELKASAYVSVRAQAPESLPIRDLGAALGVRLVLVPQFREVGGRIRLEAELVEAATGRLVGSDSWWVTSRNESELLSQLGSGMVRLIASSVGLAARPQLASRGGPGHQQYLLGKHWLGRRTPSGIRRAVQHFQSAVRYDSTSAPAYEGLSTAYILALFYRYEIGLDGYEAARRSLAAAERSVRLDPSYAPGYGALGYVISRAFGPTDEAAHAFIHALELEPNSAQSVAWSGGVLLEQGRVDEALVAIRRAIDLDPFSPARWLSLAYAAFPLGQYDVVIDAAQRASELEPELTISRAMAGRAMLLSGRLDDCAVLELGPHEGVRAACLEALGRHAEALAIIDSIERVVRAGGQAGSVYTDVVRVEDLACYYAWVGDADRAVAWLREAYRLSPLGVERRVLESAIFERLRRDPAVAERIADITSRIWPQVKSRNPSPGMP